jgi:hypothetical protein
MKQAMSGLTSAPRGWIRLQRYTRGICACGVRLGVLSKPMIAPCIDFFIRVAQQHTFHSFELFGLPTTHAIANAQQERKRRDTPGLLGQCKEHLLDVHVSTQAGMKFPGVGFIASHKPTVCDVRRKHCLWDDLLMRQETYFVIEHRKRLLARKHKFQFTIRMVCGLEVSHEWVGLSRKIRGLFEPLQIAVGIRDEQHVKHR